MVSFLTSLLKNSKSFTVGDAVEKQAFSCLAGGSAKWYILYVGELVTSNKITCAFIHWPGGSISRSLLSCCIGPISSNDKETAVVSCLCMLWRFYLMYIYASRH